MSINHGEETSFENSIQTQVMSYNIRILHMGSIPNFTHNSYIKPFNQKLQFTHLENHPRL